MLFLGMVTMTEHADAESARGDPLLRFSSFEAQIYVMVSVDAIV